MSSPLNSSDAVLLDLLTDVVPPTQKTFARRDAALDPLLLAAAAASGPHVTRNHYHHDFFPGVMLPKAEGSWDWSKWTGEDTHAKLESRRYTYVSRQGPRRQKLQGIDPKPGKENDGPHESIPLQPADNLPSTPKKRRPSLVSSISPIPTEGKIRPKLNPVSDAVHTTANSPSSSSLQVQCMARTRIPTPHGPVFLHLYHNNLDNKEHLAIVVDPAQFSEGQAPVSAPFIRSRTLDAVWSDDETETDRIIRGAYVGRLSPTSQRASAPSTHQDIPATLSPDIPPPLIRIHSECFTGETVGSMRCDCGEQLDEAIRQISRPITLPPKSSLSDPVTIPGRGAVIYLRQEGRGIGLLSKIRAYNLQDIGHDTVNANLMLGYKADERGYEIAAAILQDLGLGDTTTTGGGEGVRILTNNPDKVEALQKEGITVVERVPMIPRSWQAKNHRHHHHNDLLNGVGAGATLIGGGAVHGEDLNKYMRTKTLKLGHILPLWSEELPEDYDPDAVVIG